MDELTAFCAAAELGGIGRAAQRLHLSQPALSRRVQSLEAVAGKALLERSPHGVRMTAAGERVYARARPLTDGMRELGSLLAELRGSSDTVHLAISHTAAEILMTRALVLTRRRTSAAVEVVIANSRVVKRMIGSGEADVGVAACLTDESPAEGAGATLLDDEIVIAVPLGHPWARRESIGTGELLASPLVLRDPDAHTREVMDRALERAGLPSLQAASEVGSTQAAKDEAHELGLPTAISRLVLSPADRLEIVPVDGLRFGRRFRLFQSAAQSSATGRHLLDAFLEAAPEVVGASAGAVGITA
jgi:DNA-binding transcriptional LysR family regulator